MTSYLDMRSVKRRDSSITWLSRCSKLSEKKTDWHQIITNVLNLFGTEHPLFTATLRRKYQKGGKNWKRIGLLWDYVTKCLIYFTSRLKETNQINVSLFKEIIISSLMPITIETLNEINLMKQFQSRSLKKKKQRGCPLTLSSSCALSIRIGTANSPRAP